MSNDETNPNLIGVAKPRVPQQPFTRAILTDSHFLVPLIVFCIGVAILIFLR